MVAEFDEKDVTWKIFRTQVLGATDPSAAEKGSLRSCIMEDWQSLGLEFQPRTADNSVHASAGPFESMRERMIWLASTVEEDPFGQQLLAAGVKSVVIAHLCANEVITMGETKGPSFDLFEDIDSSVALKAVLTMQM